MIADIEPIAMAFPSGEDTPLPDDVSALIWEAVRRGYGTDPQDVLIKALSLLVERDRQRPANSSS
jgi:hypothetical protein